MMVKLLVITSKAERDMLIGVMYEYVKKKTFH